MRDEGLFAGAGSLSHQRLFVPTRYGFRDVLVKAFVDEIVIFCDGALIARHPRSYERDDFVFDPRHYLALLEQKPGALDQAAPLQGWALPEALATFAPAHGSADGQTWQTRVHPGSAAERGFAEQIVVAAALEAIRFGAVSFNAVRQLAIARIENRPARLDLSAYPYLPAPNVTTTSPADYMALSRERGMTSTASAESPAPPKVLLAHHLRQLKLPTVLREYEKVALEAAREGQDHIRYLLRLVELELIDRERRMVERRIRPPGSRR